tara:strand:+ start:601 stop:1527 length:927 start_codon:yes stop_codon:yes gene_type:complete
MKILVTGVSGFMGKNFIELAPKDLEIIGIYNSSQDIVKFVEDKKLTNVTLHKCDLTNKEDVKNLFNKIGTDFEQCIFLAGNVDVPLSKTEPFTDIEITVGSLINVLQSCNFNRFIYMSTAGVYDGINGPATTESILNPVVPYCVSKLMAEQYVKYYHASGKINQYIILRFGGAFGLYSKQAKFMTKLVNDIFVENKNEIEIYGDGTNIINVMYAKDAVKAILTCINSTKYNLLCNLGQENMTITETVLRIAKIFDKEVNIKYISKIEKQKYITFKIEVDFNDAFDFKSDFSFDEGIKEFGILLKSITD